MKRLPIGIQTFEKLRKENAVYVDNYGTSGIGIAGSCGIELTNSALPSRFAELIEKTRKREGKQVVILVDEYDKPMVDSLVDKDIHNQIKRALHDFCQAIKASDEHVKHVKFVLLRGVSQFLGLSIFSGLNNLENITMSEEFGSICGYTQEELESNFKELHGRNVKRNGHHKRRTCLTNKVLVQWIFLGWQRVCI